MRELEKVREKLQTQEDHAQESVHADSLASYHAPHAAPHAAAPSNSMHQQSRQARVGSHRHGTQPQQQPNRLSSMDSIRQLSNDKRGQAKRADFSNVQSRGSSSGSGYVHSPSFPQQPSDSPRSTASPHQYVHSDQQRTFSRGNSTGFSQYLPADVHPQGASPHGKCVQQQEDFSRSRGESPVQSHLSVGGAVLGGNHTASGVIGTGSRGLKEHGSGQTSGGMSARGHMGPTGRNSLDVKFAPSAVHFDVQNSQGGSGQRAASASQRVLEMREVVKGLKAHESSWLQLCNVSSLAFLVSAQCLTFKSSVRAYLQRIATALLHDFQSLCACIATFKSSGSVYILSPGSIRQ